MKFVLTIFMYVNSTYTGSSASPSLVVHEVKGFYSMKSCEERGIKLARTFNKLQGERLNKGVVFSCDEE